MSKVYPARIPTTIYNKAQAMSGALSLSRVIVVLLEAWVEGDLNLDDVLRSAAERRDRLGVSVVED